MTSKRWIPHSYTKNSKRPLVGEIILLPLSLNNINFPHRPASHLAPSSHHSVSNSSINHPRDHIHCVLVLSVFHNRKNKTIRLSVLPILSYSSSSRDGTGTSWNADQWMTQKATDTQRLHHLSIPAIDWIPSPSPFPGAPILSFGKWKNHHPSWAIMVRVPHSISESDKWFRHSDGPVILDGGKRSIMGIYTYLDNIIPSTLNRIAANAQSPNTPTNSLSHDGSCFSLDPLSICTASTTESELQRAFLGEDGLNPVSFWNFPGAPKELQEYAQQQQKATLNEKVLSWRDKCIAEGVHRFPVEEDDEANLKARLSAVSENVDLPDVTFGEEACGRDTSTNLEKNSGTSTGRDWTGDGLPTPPPSTRQHIQVF